MNRTLVDKLCAAVLYEGYVLYPYRPSVKNKQRWTFGGIYPQAWSETQNGAEPCLMQTECLLEGTTAKIHVIVRFLHLIDRTVGQSRGTTFEPVNSLEIGEKRYQPWQEAIEREIDLGEFSITDLLSPIEKSFHFAAERKDEILHDTDGKTAGILWRCQEAIELSITISATPLTEQIFKLTVKITNRTPLTPSPDIPACGERSRTGEGRGEGISSSFILHPSSLPGDPHPNPPPEYQGRGQEQISEGASWSRDQILLRALVSTHTILGITAGQFISLTDPPQQHKEQTKSCKNIGAWPVLVGIEPQRDTILSSPIILSDYPEIAPESPGDLFDGLEIDEILTLRIMTLTDEEKKTAVGVDERVGELLKRTESLARQQMMNLHGAIRGMKMVPEEHQP